MKSQRKWLPKFANSLEWQRQILRGRVTSWSCSRKARTFYLSYLPFTGKQNRRIKTQNMMPSPKKSQEDGQRKKKQGGGKYCVAGLPGKRSCKNSSFTPNVNMHKFPKDKTVQKLWTNFVRRHRKDFTPTTSSHLCSGHFEPTCYFRRPDILVAENSPQRNKIPRLRKLEPGAVPTIDNAPQVQKNNTTFLDNNISTPRERRKVRPKS